MDDLVAFLRARLDQDERAVQGTWTPSGGHSYELATMQGTTVLMRPARVLAEVEATRRLIRAHAKWCEGRCEAKYPEGSFDAAHYWNLKLRAEVYADHPDYRPEWRP